MRLNRSKGRNTHRSQPAPLLLLLAEELNSLGQGLVRFGGGKADLSPNVVRASAHSAHEFCPTSLDCAQKLCHLLASCCVLLSIARAPRIARAGLPTAPVA